MKHIKIMNGDSIVFETFVDRSTTSFSYKDKWYRQVSNVKGECIFRYY